MNRLILFFVFSVLLISSQTFAKTNIVFVDMPKVMSTSEVGKSILEQLKILNKKTLANFKKEEKILKEKENAIIAKKNILSSSEYIKEVDNLKLEITKYTKKRKKIINELKELKLKNTNKLSNQVSEILINYSANNAISMILKKELIITGKSNLDISEDIIELVNRNIKDFKIKW